MESITLSEIGLHSRCYHVMKRQQILLIISAFILLAVLFFFGRTVSNKKDNIAQTATKNEINFDIHQYIASVKKQLIPARLAILNKLENGFMQQHPLEKQIADYKKLAAFWKDTVRSFEPYAYYTALSAKLENSEKSMTFAANLLLNNVRNGADGALKTWMANEAKQLFEKALIINPNNDSLTVGLGACLIYSNTTNNPEEAMQGVQRILAVVKKDSTNMYAQFMLGIGGLISRQYPKSIERFITVLKHEPNNMEAMFSLAEAYELSGDKERAVKWYAICQNAIEIPEAKKELENRIMQLQGKQ